MPKRARKLTFAPNPETLVGVLTWDRSKENYLEYVKRCQTTALQRRTQKRLNELLDDQEAESYLEYVKRCQITAFQRRTQKRFNELLDEQETAAAQICPAKLTKRTLSLLLETPD